MEFSMIRSGKWLGESGKGLNLIVENGSVRGTIQVAYGRVPPDETFDVTGFTDGEFIGFTVYWTSKGKNYHSVTSWVGRYTSDEKREWIETTWLLCRQYDDQKLTKETDWESITVGKGQYYFNE
jgi:Avidin family